MVVASFVHWDKKEHGEFKNKFARSRHVKPVGDGYFKIQLCACSLSFFYNCSFEIRASGVAVTKKCL